jgi:hypothetical protein
MVREIKIFAICKLPGRLAYGVAPLGGMLHEGDELDMMLVGINGHGVYPGTFDILRCERETPSVTSVLIGHLLISSIGRLAFLSC